MASSTPRVPRGNLATAVSRLAACLLRCSWLLWWCWAQPCSWHCWLVIESDHSEQRLRH